MCLVDTSGQCLSTRVFLHLCFPAREIKQANERSSISAYPLKRVAFEDSLWKPPDEQCGYKTPSTAVIVNKQMAATENLDETWTVLVEVWISIFQKQKNELDHLQPFGAWESHEFESSSVADCWFDLNWFLTTPRLPRMPRMQTCIALALLKCYPMSLAKCHSPSADRLASLNNKRIFLISN